MRVLVIGGGISEEREVALRSASAVFSAAKQRHDAELYDWSGSKDWLVRNAPGFDVVLPIVHGVGGEDGQLQAILEEVGVPFLGSDSVVSALCFNKQKTLDFFAKNNILTPAGKVVTKEEYLADPLKLQPHVLKPFDSGSSIDLFIHTENQPNINEEELIDVFNRHPKMLLEEYISGIEISVPVLEGRTLDIIEIIPPKGGFFDYENKYNGHSKEHVPPINVSIELQSKARLLGESVHRLAGCRHISRTDMIISGDKIYVLEINTMPGMTDQSLFPRAAEASGMAFPDFVDYLINISADTDV